MVVHYSLVEQSSSVGGYEGVGSLVVASFVPSKLVS